MTDNQDKRGSLRTRWHEGQLSHHSTASTIALSLILVATLVAAKTIVVSRSGKLIAQQNAAALLEKISESGLSQLLDFSSDETMYLLEKNQEPIGYGIYFIGPEAHNEGQLTYAGRELLFRNDIQELSYSEFAITDDLSRFVYKKTIRRFKERYVQMTHQDYRDGVLSGQVQLGQRLYPAARYRADQPGLIAPFMIDFFSSLALQENYAKGVVFSLPRIAQDPRYGWMFQLDEQWIKSSQAFPDEIVQQYPYGQGGTVEPLQTMEPLQAQSLYFNMQHQLVWQKIDLGPDELIFKAVEREEILTHFPDALEVLEQWRGDSNEEDDHAIL